MRPLSTAYIAPRYSYKKENGLDSNLSRPFFILSFYEFFAQCVNG